MRKRNVPYGSDVSAGEFRCEDCGETLEVPSAKSLPPCPNFGDGKHTEKAWAVIGGQGDAPQAPCPGD